MGRDGLSPAQFEVLVALAQGDKHGYAILRDSSRGAEGPRLGAATLYRSIKQLLDARLIEEAGERADPAEGDDQRRRYYRLTAQGRRIAVSEAERLAVVVDRARRGGLIADVPTEPSSRVGAVDIGSAGGRR